MVVTNLRRIRQERRLSQRELANQLGWSQNYVYLLEAGLPPKRAEHVKQLARALRVQPEVLTGPPLVNLDEHRTPTPAA